MQITPAAQAILERFGDDEGYVFYLDAKDSDRGVEHSINYIPESDLTDRDMIFQFGKVKVAMRFDNQPHFISTVIDYIDDPKGVIFRTE